MPDRTVRMYNPTHRFDTSTEAPKTTDPTIGWEYESPQEAGVGVSDVLAVWDDSVYIPLSDRIVSIDQDGAVQWRFQTDAALPAKTTSPAVVDGTVYTGCTDKHVYALDADCGTEQWRFQTDGAVHTSPAVVDGTVYVGSENNHMYALDADSGLKQWHFQIDLAYARCPTSPAVVDSFVYIGSVDHIYALDANSGVEQWRFQTDGWTAVSPTVVDGTVYTGCTDKHVYALDATRGTEKWRFRLDESMRSSPAVMDGIIYVVDRNQVYALDANTGTIQWASNLDRNHYEPVVADSTVYIAGDRLVQALDANTGTQQWVFEPPGLGHGVTPPTVRDGTIYIGSGNDSGTDTVYALGVGDDRVDAQAGQLNRDENAGTGTDVSREETEQPETKP